MNLQKQQNHAYKHNVSQNNKSMHKNTMYHKTTESCIKTQCITKQQNSLHKM